MENILLISIGFIFYEVFFEIPKRFKKLDDKMDLLKLHLMEIEL